MDAASTHTLTTFQIWIIAISGGGFLLTAGGVIGACVWAVAKIKQDITEKITNERDRVDKMVEAERENFQRSMRAQLSEFAEEQRRQDHNTGEMGAALRRFIESVEREMHKIEIWGRDNFALKKDVDDKIAVLREDIRVLGSEMKVDMRAIFQKLDQRQQQS